MSSSLKIFSNFIIHSGCENNRREDVGDKAKKVKQKLLEEMLRQKHELERKQAERQKVIVIRLFKGIISIRVKSCCFYHAQAFQV